MCTHAAHLCSAADEQNEEYQTIWKKNDGGGDNSNNNGSSSSYNSFVHTMNVSFVSKNMCVRSGERKWVFNQLSDHNNIDSLYNYKCRYAIATD